MKVQRGEVVIIDHPFSDARGSKVRPVLIVQSNHRNALLASTIVALITKNVQRVGSDASQLLIDVLTPDGKLSGLRVPSAVTCGNLFTVHESRIRKRIGHLSVRLMQRVDTCLRTALDLP